MQNRPTTDAGQIRGATAREMHVRWSVRALADLDRIAARIAMDKPTVATECAPSISETITCLSVFPVMGRTGAYQHTRERVVPRNYLVTYRVRADEIQLLQVWHQARNGARGTSK